MPQRNIMAIKPVLRERERERGALSPWQQSVEASAALGEEGQTAAADLTISLAGWRD